MCSSDSRLEQQPLPHTRHTFLWSECLWKSCSVEMTVKCAAPYSNEYQKGALEGTGPLFFESTASLSGMMKRLATATPHSPPESFPARRLLSLSPTIQGLDSLHMDARLTQTLPQACTGLLMLSALMEVLQCWR